MSGTLATVAGVIGNVLSLLTGGAPVTLGDFEFADFEVPERVRWGGAQQLAVHTLQGGARVIDALGPADSDITWSGILGITQDATARALDLDQMRQDGAPVTLTWGEFSRTVVVKDCTFDQQYGRIGYSITCTVQPEDTGTNGVAPSPLAQVQDDINSALGFDLTGTLAAAGSALGAVQSIAAPLVGFVAPGAASGLLAGLSGVQGLLGTATTAADAVVVGAADTANVVASVGALPGALAAAQASAFGQAASGYVARAVVNL